MRSGCLAVCLVLVQLAGPAMATDYYVDGDAGDDFKGNGLSPGVHAWSTIQRAMMANSPVAPGDRVFVKLASRPYGKVVVYKSGIEIIGYRHQPGDLDGGDGVPQVYTDIRSVNYSGKPKRKVTESPEIWGASRASGVAVDFNGNDDVQFRNFWVGNAVTGIRMAGSDRCILKNLYVRNCGDPAHDHDGTGVYLSPRRGLPLDGSEENVFQNCTLYNTGQYGITLHHRSSRNRLEHCRVFSDDDSGYDVPGRTSTSVTHYYFLVVNGDENRFVGCSAHLYPDPESIATGKKMPRHPGHGFTIVANGAKNERATGNSVIDCDTKDIQDVILLRYTGVQDNLFHNVCSVVENEASETVDPDDPDGKRRRPIGRIQFLGGPRENIFQRCRFTNSDVAIGVFGSMNDEAANDQRSAASLNLFAKCVFECEQAIALSDYDDERGDQQRNGNLYDGTVQYFKGNVFWHCDFIGDPEPTNRPASGIDNQNRFFESSRGAENNWLISCIVSNFDRFSEGTSGVNARLTPLRLVGEQAFVFKRCYFDINNDLFWLEASPDDSQQFDVDDLGEGNSLATLTEADPAGDGSDGVLESERRQVTAEAERWLWRAIRFVLCILTSGRG